MHFVKEADFNISDIKIKKMAALFGHKVETERGEDSDGGLRGLYRQQTRLYPAANGEKGGG